MTIPTQQKPSGRFYKAEDIIFFWMRVALVAAAVGLYTLVRLFPELNFDPRNMGWALTLFLLWSGLAAGAICLDRRRRTRHTARWKKWIVGVSLPVDGYFVQFVAGHNGGLDSPFFDALYVLIIYHAYYFPSYLSRHAPRLPRWGLSGGIAGLGVFVVVYLSLIQGGAFPIFDFIIDTGLALMLAFTATVLRRLDRETNRALRRRNEIAQLFQGIIRSVNAMKSADAIDGQPLHAAEAFAEHLNFNELARTIGENLSSLACEVFIRENGRSFRRRGLWIREGDKKTAFENFFAGHAKVQVDSEFESKDKKYRVGRFVRGPVGAEHTPPKLAEIMPDFLQNELVAHSLFTLILRKMPGHRFTPIGLIRVTNRVHRDGRIHQMGFSEDDEFIIEDVAKEISSGIDNFRLQALMHEKRAQEQILRRLTFESEPDSVFHVILQSLTEMVNGEFAELWVPFEEGFARTPRLILRSHYAAKGAGAPDLATLPHAIGVQDSYIGQALLQAEKDDTIRYEPDISKIRQYGWAAGIDQFGTRQLVALRLARDGETLGIVCLHPAPDFTWSDEIGARLQEYARLAAVTIEETRYRKRYRQLSALHRELDRLLGGEGTAFHRNLLALVRDVMRAESCYIFIRDNDGRAYVRESFPAGRPEGKPEVVQIEAEHRLMRELAQAGRSIIFFGKMQEELLPLQRMQIDPDRRNSIILAPIHDSQGQMMGFVYCLNSADASGLIANPFTRGDNEVFDLSVDIIGALMENRMNIERLETADRQKQNFLSSISHEFNTPLHSIRTTVEFLKRFHNVPEKLKDADAKFDLLLEEVDFLKYLVANIRSLYVENVYEFQAGERTETDLFKMVEKIQTLLLGQAHDRRLKIKLFGRFPSVVVDRFHLEQVIFNLLMNAIKYTPPNTEKPIEIACQQTSTYIMISVRNWGIGIRVEEVSRIFEMFERGIHAHKASVSGSGLGLYISRKIMRSMQGDLCLTQLANPTEFTVFIPIE